MPDDFRRFTPSKCVASVDGRPGELYRSFVCLPLHVMFREPGCRVTVLVRVPCAGRFLAESSSEISSGRVLPIRS